MKRLLANMANLGFSLTITRIRYNFVFMNASLSEYFSQGLSNVSLKPKVSPQETFTKTVNAIFSGTKRT